MALSIEEIDAIARELWKHMQPVMVELAQSVYKAHELPPAAAIMIPRLADLLIDLQQQAFEAGVVATIANIQELVKPWRPLGIEVYPKD